MLIPGIYEQVINNALEKELADNHGKFSQTAPIDAAEASHVLSKVFRRSFSTLLKKGADIPSRLTISRIVIWRSSLFFAIKSPNSNI